MKPKLAAVFSLAPKESKGSKGASGEDDAEEEDAEADEDEARARVEAAQAILDAIKAGDAEALTGALEKHYELC